MIVAGFIIMLVPESVQQKVACWKEGQCPCERQKLDEEGAEPVEGEKGAEPRETDEAGPKDGKDWTRLEQCDNDDP